MSDSGDPHDGETSPWARPASASAPGDAAGGWASPSGTGPASPGDPSPWAPHPDAGTQRPGATPPSSGTTGHGTTGHGTTGHGTTGHGTTGHGTTGHGTTGQGTPRYGASGYGTTGYQPTGYGLGGYGRKSAASSEQVSARTSPDELTGPGGDGSEQRRRTLLGFGIAGGAALAIGLVAILVLAGTGFFSNPDRPFPLPGRPDPQPSRPPLAQLCPAPTSSPELGGEALPPVPGPRVSDPDSGISYLVLGAPFKPWDRGTWGSGTLGVQYRTGYYFITETYQGGDYLASVLSGKVPATVGDSLQVNLECAGRQVAEDVRHSYYPQPNVKEQIRDERVVVGGRPAWVSTFHLRFSEDGLKAKGEAVAVVLVDVGRPDAAILYISIPDTHKQYAAEIDKVIASIASV